MMNEHLTKTENKTLETLFFAIYFNDLESVIAFKNECPELYEKKSEFLIIDKTFDLVNLTFLNQIFFEYLHQREWSEQATQVIQKHYLLTKKMSEFWCTELGIQSLQRGVEYNHFYDFFFCEDPDNVDMIILSPMSEYLEQGFREIDLRLYNRVECFDFKAVQELLAQGARPDVELEAGHNALMRIIESRNSGLYYPLTTFIDFEKHGYNQKLDVASLFSGILGIAAHIEMWYVLKKYMKP